MMIRKHIFVTLLLIIWGCSGSKKIQQNLLPAWIKQRPTSDEYYVGIGSAKKSATDYMQSAKQNALADLASDISVFISSRSVIEAFQLQQKFAESFASTIQAETQKQLDGYELVDTYDDGQNYWVYYRLSKNDYQRKLENKKNEAIQISFDYFKKAKTALNNHEPQTALNLLIRSLEPIKPYFNQTLTVVYNNDSIYLGNEIVQLIVQTLNNIVIIGPREITSKLGQPIDPQKLTYQVLYQLKPVSSIPIGFELKNSSTPSKKLNSDASGNVSFGVEALRTRKNVEFAQVKLDFETIVRQSTNDLLIRKMLNRFAVPTTETQINVIKPTIFIESIEEIFNNPQPDKPILTILQKKFLSEGFIITSDVNDADFIISIQSNAINQGRQDSYYRIELTPEVNVLNKQQIKIYTYSSKPIIEKHFEPTPAAKAAYDKFIKRIEVVIADEIINTLIKQ